MLIDSEKLAKRIAKARKDKRLSQTQLAQKAGACRNTIASIERGDKCPRWDTAVAIINALEISSAQLEGGEDA